MFFKQIWSGTWSVGSTITVSELAYYNLFVFYTNSSYTPGLIGMRSNDGTSMLATMSHINNSKNLNITAMTASIKSSTSMTLSNAYRYEISTSSVTRHSDVSIVKIMGVL